MTIGKVLRRVGSVSGALHAASFGSIGLGVALGIRAQTVDQEERGNAERRALFVGRCSSGAVRRALFVGLWPPMFWLFGDTARKFESR